MECNCFKDIVYFLHCPMEDFALQFFIFRQTKLSLSKVYMQRTINKGLKAYL